MMKYNFNDATPYYPTPVGEVIEEELTRLNMTRSELSKRAGIPRRELNEVIEGRKLLAREYASSLGRIFGVSPSYLMNIQEQYKKDCEKIPHPRNKLPPSA